MCECAIIVCDYCIKSFRNIFDDLERAAQELHGKVVTRCSFNTVDMIQVNMVPRWWCGSQYVNHFSSLENKLGPRSVPLPRIIDDFSWSPANSSPGAQADSVHEVVQCSVQCATGELQCSVLCTIAASLSQ